MEERDRELCEETRGREGDGKGERERKGGREGRRKERKEGGRRKKRIERERKGGREGVCKHTSEVKVLQSEPSDIRMVVYHVFQLLYLLFQQALHGRKEREGEERRGEEGEGTVSVSNQYSNTIHNIHVHV